MTMLELIRLIIEAFVVCVSLYAIISNRRKTSGDAFESVTAALKNASLSWEQVFNIAKTVPALQHEIEDLKRAVKDRDLIIDDLREREEKREEDMSATATAMKTLTDRVEELELENRNLRGRVTALESELSDERAKVASRDEQIKQLESERTARSGRLSGFEAPR